ncbi:MAG: IS4 family transposase [Candidatus Competibacteraceae bacterium]
MIYLIIAWRILYLVTEGQDTNLPCDVVFDPEEWQATGSSPTARQTPAIHTPGQMARLIAGFGGFLGRKRDGHPGPKALWKECKSQSVCHRHRRRRRKAFVRLTL